MLATTIATRGSNSLQPAIRVVVGNAAQFIALLQHQLAAMGQK